MTNIIAAELMKKCGDDYSRTGNTAYIDFKDISYAVYNATLNVTGIKFKTNDGRYQTHLYLNGDVIGEYLRQTESIVRKKSDAVGKYADNPVLAPAT